MKTTVLVLLLLPLFIRSTAQNSKPSEFKLRFQDVATGYSIIPKVIEIEGTDRNFRYSVPLNQVSKNGTVAVPVPNGFYNITVSATGYQMMSSSFQINNQALQINFNLQSLHPPKELSSAYIRSLHRSDAMILVGFIVDDETGKPLNKVTIYSQDKKVKTVTGNNGFFQLVLPLPRTEKELERRGVIAFELNGYTTELRENFDMWPYGDAILQIRMKRGKGINKEKILLGRIAERIILNQGKK